MSHSELPHFIINMNTLHNQRDLRAALPHHLTKLPTWFGDRTSIHTQAAASLRDAKFQKKIAKDAAIRKQAETALNAAHALSSVDLIGLNDSTHDGIPEGSNLTNTDSLVHHTNTTPVDTPVNPFTMPASVIASTHPTLTLGSDIPHGPRQRRINMGSMGVVLPGMADSGRATRSTRSQGVDHMGQELQSGYGRGRGRGGYSAVSVHTKASTVGSTSLHSPQEPPHHPVLRGPPASHLQLQHPSPAQLEGSARSHETSWSDSQKLGAEDIEEPYAPLNTMNSSQTLGAGMEDGSTVPHKRRRKGAVDPAQVTARENQIRSMFNEMLDS